MSLVLRYMRLSDVFDVMRIEHRVFSSPWSAQSYQYEIDEATYSFMVVLEDVPDDPSPAENPLKRFLTPQAGQLLGYGGLWNIQEEAHISTIATHPDHQGKGYGERLLAAMIARSIMLRAEYIVLEVRVSNEPAIALYRKYEFAVADTKRGYYHKEKEDAYDMRLDLTDAAMLERFAERRTAITQRVPCDDQFSETPHPRLNR